MERIPARLMEGDEKIRCADGTLLWVMPEIESPGEQQAPVWTGRWVVRTSERGRPLDRAVLTAEVRDLLVERLSGLPFEDHGHG